MENNIRKFRLIFEEVVPEGNCKGSVLRRYVELPLTIIDHLSGLSDYDVKIFDRKLVEYTLNEFKDFSLIKWDKIEGIEEIDGSYPEDVKEEVEN